MIFKKDEIDDSMDDYVSRKEFNKLKRRINSHQSYLNFINTFYELEPKPFLEQLTGLSPMSVLRMALNTGLIWKHCVQLCFTASWFRGMMR